MAIRFSVSPKACPANLLPHPFPLSVQISFQSIQRPVKHPRHPRSALREWQEYEEAVKRKDLATALRFLIDRNTGAPLEETLENGSSPTDSTRSRLRELEFGGESQRDWEVLDTCLNADDMRLVGSAYRFLKDRGFLPNFGRFSAVGILLLLLLLLR